MRHNLRATIAVVFCFALGCGSAEDRPADSMPPDSPGDSGAETGPIAQDMGTDSEKEPDVGLDVTNSPDFSGDMPPQLCESLSATACFERADCVWDGQACKSPAPTGVIDSPTASTLMGGMLAGVDQASLEHPSLLSVVQTEAQIQGSLAFTRDDADVTILVHGAVDEPAGQMRLSFSVPACAVGQGECDAMITGFEARGSFDGTQWLFSRASSPQGYEGAPLFQNFRYQPNDGIKPSNVREGNLRGNLTTIFDGVPLDPQQECFLTVPSKSEDRSGMPSLSCDKGPGVGLESVRMIPDTFATEAERVWFRIEAAGQQFTFIGVDDYDIGGVLVVDDDVYWSAEATPIRLSAVQPEHVIGAVVFEPTNVAF